MANLSALLLCFFYLLSPQLLAQSAEKNGVDQSLEKREMIQPSEEKQLKDNQLDDVQIIKVEKTPEVGKHVMANMDAGSMIVSLLMVLGLIIVSALILKRFNITQQGSNQIKTVASLSLGSKERLVVVQIGKQQLVLGVCPQQITLLKQLETPLSQTGKPLAISKNVLAFLQKKPVNAKNINKNQHDNTSNSDDDITTNN